MVPVILAGTSAKKDPQTLRELYWKAGVTEYWVVDARSDRQPPAFTIFVHSPQGYVPQAEPDGRPSSTVLGHAFELIRGTDPLGHPTFTLKTY
jgi:Uma2 family endonuclease